MSNIFDEVTATSTTAKTTLGTTRVIDDKSYVYVQLYASATAAASDGTVLYATLSDTNVVTDDISTSSINLIRGVAVGAIALGSYGWIQTWGDHAGVNTNGDDDIATGDTIIGDATADGVCNSVTEGTASTYRPIGIATSVDSNTHDTVATFITISQCR